MGYKKPFRKNGSISVRRGLLRGTLVQLLGVPETLNRCSNSPLYFTMPRDCSERMSPSAFESLRSPELIAWLLAALPADNRTPSGRSADTNWNSDMIHMVVAV